MNAWLPPELVQALGWTLIHFLWQGLVIAAVLGATLRLMRCASAQYKCLAACSALALMALAPLVTFRLVMPPREAISAAVEVPVETGNAEIPHANTTTTLPSIVVVARPEPRAPRLSEKLELAFPWLVLGWVAGVCLLSCRLLAGWLQVRRLRQKATQSLPWTDALAALARRLGVNRPIRLLQSALVEVPTVIGWLRPVILLPVACVTGLSPGQLEAIVAHELAHIRRHDYLINLLQSIVETLLFYHPAVWWVSRRIREERELCCDDLAVELCGDRVGYARALATLEELRPASAQLALAAGGAPLLRRIRRLVGQPERSPGRGSWPVAGIIVLLVLGVLAAGMKQHRATAVPQTDTANAEINGETNGSAAIAAKDQLQESNAAGDSVENKAGVDPADRANSPQTPFIVNGSPIDTNTNGMQWFYYISNKPPLVNLKVKFVEIDQHGSNAWGFQWGTRTNTTTVPPVASAVTGILTEAQYRATIAALQQRDGTEVLTAPEVTTESGRQAQVRAIDVQHIVGANGFRFGATGAAIVASNAATPAFNPTNAVFASGPTLDVIAYVSHDNRSLQMTLIPSATEFIGYSKPGNAVPQGSVSPDTNVISVLPLPHFRLRQTVTRVKVWDGQTVVIGGLMSDVPVAGSNPPKTIRKNVMVFVTAALVNLDGTPYHSEEERKALGAKPPPQDAARLPQETNIETIPKAATSGIGSQNNNGVAGSNAVYVAVLVQDGKFLYEAGKYDEAEVEFKKALKIDPSNFPASQFLRLVNERRLEGPQIRTNSSVNTNHVFRSGQYFSTNHPYSGTNAIVSTGQGRQANVAKNDPASANAILQVDESWDLEQRLTQGVASPNSFNRTNLVYTGKGRKAIIAKLEQIPIEKANFTDIELPVVLNELAKTARERDPDGQGVNFFLDRLVPAAQQTTLTLFDTNGNPRSISSPPDMPDVTRVKVRVHLQNARLADVLDTIVENADHPIKYSILDYAVVFSLKDPNEPPGLEIRTFHVDPNTFLRNLRFSASNIEGSTTGSGGGGVSGASADPWESSGAAAGGSVGPNGGSARGYAAGPPNDYVRVTPAGEKNTSAIASAVRSYFLAAGVDLNSNAVVIFNDRKGTLTVRATRQDLDLVEAAVQILNSSSPEINIKARFIEITFRPGNTNALFDSDASVLSSNSMFLNPPALVTNVDTSSIPGGRLEVVSPINTPTGILTEPQYRALLNALQKRDGTDVLTAPEVTMESGRRAQVQAVTVQTVMYNLTNNYGSSNMNFGVTMDITASVSADQFEVNMELVPAISEFLGYDPPVKESHGKFSGTKTSGGRIIVRPIIRTRKMKTSVTVWDGQTVVLGGLMTASTNTTTDKVPLLGDLPLMGRAFRSQSSQTVKKQIFVFVTPTIINPDGTRYHTDDQMPWARSTPPPQQNSTNR